MPYGDDYIESFHGVHEKKYGYCNRNNDTEIVNIRLRASSRPDKPEFSVSHRKQGTGAEKANLGKTFTVFSGKSVETKIMERDRLRYGNVIRGPAVIVEYSSTIVIPPFAIAHVDKLENIIITVHTH